MKVFAKKRPRFARPPVPLPVQLRNLGAEIVENHDAYLLLQLPIPNASAAPTVLHDLADVVQILSELDLVRFHDFPLDARQPSPAYPPAWHRPVGLPSPARDAFVIQFATSPRTSWVQELKAAGVAILDSISQNGYVVLGDEAVLRRIVARLPVQLFRLHQPVHKASAAVRAAPGAFTDVVVSIANVPESAEAVGLLNQRTLRSLRPPEPAGDRTLYRVTIETTALRQLAMFPAVLSMDLYIPPVPSGQREVHLTLGDTLVTNAGDVLRPVLGDHRQWITSKGVGNYKTAVKMAILDTGFDIGSSSDVAPDFRDSANNSFVTVRRYTRTPGSDADCYGHGTFVAGVLAGNAGSPNSTQTKDTGSQHGDADYFMGLGIVPEMPLVVGRVFNYLSVENPPPLFEPQDRHVIYADLLNLGVGITSNSWNDALLNTYTAEARIHDQLVRSANGVNRGPPMTIYFSGGNNEGGINQPRISSPATAKNVISVGGSENFNPVPYPEPPDPPFTPSATGGIFADNGNHFWSVSQIGPTASDGRIKPDLVAPASGIESTRTRNTSLCRTPGGNTQVGVLIDPGSPVGQQHLWSRGTSFSAPLAAGAGALLYTWFKNVNGGTAPLPSMLKAMQITFAHDLSGTGAERPGRPPDARQGWGKADLTRAFATDNRYVWNNEESNTLLTELVRTVFLPAPPNAGYRIKDITKPVRVTIVWTDAAGVALVNDLNLTVRMQGSGNGRYALGNDFNISTGLSNVRTSGGTPDNRNNVEQVAFTYADANADHFLVEVFAMTLGGDGINAWSHVANQQNFALFIENAEVNLNNAAVLSQQTPTVQAGAPFSGTVEMRNDGNTPWTEGLNNFYRLASMAAGNPFGGRVFLIPETEVIQPGGSKIFTINATAPYAAGTYPFRWQMVEELVQFFGPISEGSVVVTPRPSSFFTLTPCRVVDTRGTPGPYGGPALAPGSPRVFALRGQCGIPATATVVSVNLTAVDPTGNGHFIAFPSNIGAPAVSTLNYRTGLTRANNALLTVDTLGQVSFETTHTTHLLLDVNGYFE